MGIYSIEWGGRAQKELRRIGPQHGRRILDAVQKLADDPMPDGCRKLRGLKNEYRIRIGDYRVIYEIGQDVIMIHKVGHRRDVYRP